MKYIISYDTPDDRRRQKLAKYLENYGIRIQYSVFECELSLIVFKRVREEIEYLINAEEDNLRIFPICAECSSKIERIGIKGVFENVQTECYLL